MTTQTIERRRKKNELLNKEINNLVIQYQANPTEEKLVHIYNLIKPLLFYKANQNKGYANKNYFDVEDMVSDFYEKFIVCLKQFDEAKHPKFTSYIMTAMNHMFIDKYYRLYKRKKRGISVVSLDTRSRINRSGWTTDINTTYIDTMIDTHAEENFGISYLVDSIEAFKETVKPQIATFIDLVVYKDMSRIDAGKAIGVSKPTATRYMYKLQDFIREEMKAEELDFI